MASAHAACTVRGQEVSDDCVGVSVDRDTSPFETISRASMIVGLSEGAHVLPGGRLDVIGNADLVIVEEGARATISGVVHDLENRGGDVVITGVVNNLAALGGTTVIEGIVEEVTGDGTIEARPGSRIDDVETPEE